MKKLPRLVKVVSYWLLVIGFLFFAAASLRSIKAQEEVKIPGPDLEEASFITVEDLQVGDWVFVKSDENGLAPEKITKLKWIEGSIEVYNLTVEEEETFFADSFAVHNKACTGISYSLSPSSPPANTIVTVNISRVGATPCSGNWNNVGLKLDGADQGIGSCYADGSNCSQGYHAYINSGGAGGHTLQFTVNSGACSCNSYSFTTTACTPHASYACYNNDVYWYDSCGDREEKKQECGGHYWADEYRCSGNWQQRLHVYRGCSGNSCYRVEVWENWWNCGSSYWANEYRCSGNWRQRKHVYRYCLEGNWEGNCLRFEVWENWWDCGSDYWTNEYRCVGIIKQRKIIRRWCTPQDCRQGEEWINVGTCCTSHTSYACYNNDVYWYDSCGNREEKKEECGSSGWTNNYRCSGQYRQRQYVHRDCSGSSCRSWSEWRNVQNCGGNYWTDEYRCVGIIKQRKIIRRGCSGGSCYNYPEWVDVGVCCVCSGWSDQDCGQWECPATKMHQTQSCNPGGCDDEDQCVDNPQCVGTVSGYIWNDANNSDGAGKDPPSEQNYTASAVTVRYSCPSGDSSVDTSNGNYSFSNVPPEACSVLIDTGDLATGWSTTTSASVGVVVPGGGGVTANFGVWDNPKPWFQGCNGSVYGLGVSVSVPYECQGCCDRWFLGADPNAAGGVVISGNATLSCSGRCNERGSSPGWNVKNQAIGWSSSLSFSPPPGATTITSKNPVLDPGKSYIWDRSELPVGSNKYQLGSGVAVLYVNGNFTINGKFNSDNPQTQGVILVVNGNVTINRDNAGDSLVDTGSDLDVAIIAKGTISITGNNPQKRLIIKGMLYGKGGISVTGEELEDNRYPRLQTIYNPLYFDPSNPLAKNSIIWREVAP